MNQNSGQVNALTEDLPQIPVPWFLVSSKRLFCVLFVSLAVPLSLFFFVLVFQTQHYFKLQAIDKSEEAVHLGAEAVENYFSGLISYGEIFSGRQMLLKAIEEKNSELAQNLLKEMVEKKPEDIERAFIADVHGIERYDYPHDPKVIGVDFSKRDWFQGVSTQGKSYVSGVYQRAAAPRLYVVAIAVPIGERNKGIQGYLVLQTPVEVLARRLASMRTPFSEGLYLIDHYGFVATRIGPAQALPLDLSKNSLVQKMLQKPEGSTEDQNPVSGHPSIMSWKKIPVNDWALVMSQDLEAVLATPQAIKKIIAALILTFFFLMLALGWLWVSIISQYHRQRKQALGALLQKTLELASTRVEKEQLEFFAFTAAHDLQSPLHKIVTLADLLNLQHPEFSAQIKKDLERIGDSAIHMRKMMEQLRELCRVTAPDVSFAETDLGEVVRDVLRNLEIKISEARAEIQVETLPKIYGNRMQMFQVFENLINNALKFIAPGVSPKIRITARSVGGGEAEICVEDNGIGFDEASADQLFKPFCRLHSSGPYPGSGIGLALVHNIVVRHRGRMAVRSRVGEGTVFSVFLPLRN